MGKNNQKFPKNSDNMDQVRAVLHLVGGILRLGYLLSQLKMYSTKSGMHCKKNQFNSSCSKPEDAAERPDLVVVPRLIRLKTVEPLVEPHAVDLAEHDPLADARVRIQWHDRRKLSCLVPAVRKKVEEEDQEQKGLRKVEKDIAIVGNLSLLLS